MRKEDEEFSHGATLPARHALARLQLARNFLELAIRVPPVGLACPPEAFPAVRFQSAPKSFQGGGVGSMQMHPEDGDER